MSSTVHTQTFDGIPVLIPNKTINGYGFYVSYNNYDIGIYGCATTALVDDGMVNFWILNGDHRKGYAPLIQQGFDACFAYFMAHLDQINEKFSTKPEEK